MKPHLDTQEGAPLSGSQRLELAAVTGPDLPLLQQFVRAYYLEDGHSFREDSQPAALAALVGDEPLAGAWLIRLDGRPVGYVVLALTFSVEAGGREACVDEFYLVPEMRNQGLGSRALALVEGRSAEAARAPDLPRGSARQPGDRTVSPRRVCRSRPFPHIEVPDAMRHVWLAARPAATSRANSWR
jgi:GNAT superfamily N-acetyltransferase